MTERTPDASNLKPDFAEHELLLLAKQYEEMAEWIRMPSSTLTRNNLERAAMIRRAVLAYETLRERCLTAETRERILLNRLAELERQ